MDRRLLIAANWKMNPIPHGALSESSPYHPQSVLDVVVFPTYIDLKEAIAAKLIVGGQFASTHPCGAHTGDICTTLLKEIGCRYQLCGHSERRGSHGETDDEIAAQVVTALEHGLHPLVCIGETETERSEGKELDVVKRQLELLPLESDLTIAYEPVWAIGTGNTATPEQAQQMHSAVRAMFPSDRQEHVRILYGGSVKPENAHELLEQPDIDGALVGGAALVPTQFQNIVNTAISLSV